MTTEKWSKTKEPKPRERIRGTTRAGRLRCLEQMLRPLISQLPDEAEICIEEYFAHTCLQYAQGWFDREPDFPEAFREYQEALQEAKTDPTLNFLPPPEFMPSANHLQRRRAWREDKKFPRLDRAWLWIATMTMRLYSQEPPLTQKEWEHLQDWLLQNHARLAQEDFDECLPEGKSLNLEQLVLNVRKIDSKHPLSNEVIHHLRWLYAHYSEKYQEAGIPR